MKLKIEYLPPGNEEEIVIRCFSKNEQIKQIEHTLEKILSSHAELAVTLGDTEYYIPKNEILFFETLDGKVAVHTANGMYYTKHKLFELENTMPCSFLRVSKSCILNAEKVNSLAHNLAGASRVTFYGSDKIVYVSRAYYKDLKEKIYNLRFNNI